MKKNYKSVFVFFFFLLHNNLIAQIKLPNILGSNMVLQQGQSVPLWGWAKPGKLVKVSFNNQLKTAIAEQDSSWRVILDPLNSSSVPQTITISSDTSTVLLSNILVGEVWLASGQSNMEYPLDGTWYAKPLIGVDSAKIALQEKHPGIRVFNVQRKMGQPDVVTKGWHDCEGPDFGMTCAAAFYFAEKLQSRLNVPVGIITSAWGGTRIEDWTPVTAYSKMPVFESEASKEPVPIDGFGPGPRYKSMIAPLVPFSLKGVIWYQGEANTNFADSRYAYKMQALIASWRKAWQNEKMPFYYVELAPFFYTQRKDNKPHTDEDLPIIWEQQSYASKIPYTGFVTTTDLVDTLSDIHPSYKWEVGRRLAMLAMNKSYNCSQCLYLGPKFKNVQRKGNKLILEFDNATGLHTKDGKKPNFFTLAGKDGKFLSANAIIEGSKVLLSNPQIKHS